MSASNHDFLFAQEAQRLGYVTEAQVEEAFKLQAIMAEQLKINECIEVILVKRGWLAEEQARRVGARLEPEGRKGEIEGYRLLEKIGRGAMGTVYRALHLGLQRVVAIKVLHKDLATDDTQVERLKSEAKLLASLDHPNIVRALDAGESGGFPYIVMEYVEGETLRERLQRQGPFPEQEALRIVRGLADALERARRMGVVHRDVKPGNVLLTRQGEPKLMDLGLAKGPVDLELTQHGATVGTPQYISPEQAQDPRSADTRSDIYSLGATLYALVTGRPPFDGSTLAEILSKVLYEAPTPPRLLRPDLSAATSWLIEHMMVKDRSLRYATPAEVVADIDRLLAGQSIVPAGFRGNWEAFLLRRRIRRRSTFAAVSVAVLALALVGGRGWLRTREAEDDRTRAQALVDARLPELAYTQDDSLGSVQRKLRLADEALSQVQDVEEPPPSVAALRRQRDRLESLYACLLRWSELVSGAGGSRPAPGAVTVSRLAEAGRFRAAFDALDAFEARIEPPGPDNPLLRLLRDQRTALREANQKLWSTLATTVRLARPASLEEWVAVYEDFDRRASAGFLPEGASKDGGAVASALKTAATAVWRAVERLEGDYGRDAVEQRLVNGTADRLRADVERDARTLLEAVPTLWHSEALSYTPMQTLLGSGGLVSLRVADLRERVHGQAAALAQRTAEGAQALLAQVGLPAATARLKEVESSLWRAGYREDATAVQRAREGLEHGALSQAAASQTAYAQVLAGWLDALAPLEAAAPERMRLAATPSAETLALLDADRREDVRALREAASRVDRLYVLALQGLAELAQRKQRLVPRLRSGAGPEKGWVLLAVDPAAFAFEVPGGRSSERLRRSLFELAPAQIVELAAAARGPGDEGALALGALALVPRPAEPLSARTDLHARLQASQAAERALEQAGLSGPLLEHAVETRRRLEAEVLALENHVVELFDRANDGMLRRKWSSALYYLAELLRDPSHRGARSFLERKTRIEAMQKAIDEELEQDNMGRWLPGARARRLEGGAWEIRYDFDSDEQIRPENFLHGRGVLEPYTPVGVTPGGEKNQRLHLLRGYETPVRERPLTWASIFDPAEPITVAFDIYALRQPGLLALDVDGLHVAVLSLDPAWLPGLLLPQGPPPLGLPELPGEKKPPRVAWYGQGRGVAFHDGLDFGDIAAWTDGRRGPGSAWPAEARGHRFAEWAGRRDLTGGLFAFPPDERLVHRVKVVRERARLSLYVADQLVASESRPEWGQRGTGSERAPGMSRGSGLIQILTCTPMAIDNLTFTGVVKERWLRDRQRGTPPPPPDTPR